MRNKYNSSILLRTDLLYKPMRLTKFQEFSFMNKDKECENCISHRFHPTVKTSYRHTRGTRCRHSRGSKPWRQRGLSHGLHSR